jgi:seryl-tRNA(Sec) selenium transferase
MEKLNEKEKEELILKDLRKLRRIFKNLDKDRKVVAEKLCKKAAFMDVTLDEMQSQIVAEGYVVEAVNGNGFTVQMDHPAMKTYNTMIKNYTTVMKQLADLLPEGAEEADELLAYVGRKKK